MMQMLLALAASPVPSGTISMSSPVTARENRRSGSTVTIFLCGDVMLGRGIDQVLPFPSDPKLHEGYVDSALGYVRLAEEAHGPIPRPIDFDYVWGAALDEWRRVNPDLRLINLEAAITRSDAFEPKGINYRMSPENAGCLLAAGVDCCGLANNHVLDWGEPGLIETLQVLKRLGISAAGAGRNLAEARAPAVLDISGTGRVIVLYYAMMTSGTLPNWAATPTRPGVNLLPDLSNRAVDQIARQVRAVRQEGDVVIASIHWGPNWGYTIPDEHTRFAHALIDRAAVSILHGHSSHHPIAIERYHDRLILYGCGDFLNDYEGIAGYEEFRSDLSLMYFVTVDAVTGDLIGLEMTPLQIHRFRLNHATDEDAEWVQRRLDRECRRFDSRITLGPGHRLILS
jgi:poly-gamma-glutamate capsule biosynthesis protein CapA/YwtB (metallophosphatase superfamily)